MNTSRTLSTREPAVSNRPAAGGQDLLIDAPLLEFATRLIAEVDLPAGSASVRFDAPSVVMIDWQVNPPVQVRLDTGSWVLDLKVFGSVSGAPRSNSQCLGSIEQSLDDRVDEAVCSASGFVSAQIVPVSGIPARRLVQFS